MNWIGTSEVVLGLVVAGAIPRTAVDESLLYPTYADTLKLLKKHSKENASDLILDKFGPDQVSALINAVEAAEGIETDWNERLRRSHLDYTVGEDLEATGRKLKRGEDIDRSQLAVTVLRLDNTAAEFAPADQIKPRKVHFRDSHDKAIQRYLPGIPKGGLLTIAGLPKIGKTRLLLKLAHAQHLKGEYTIIFSFEQPPDELVASYIELFKPSRATLARMIVYQGQERLDPIGVSTRAIQMASSLSKKPTLIGVDYADYLIKGSSDEPKMTEAYVEMARLGWQLDVCVVLLAQFNDQAYRGGIPLPGHIRYGRMAVAASTMLWCLYNPHRKWGTSEDDARLPPIKTKVGRGKTAEEVQNAYIINWVSRFGFGKDDYGRDRTEGAIRLPWSPSGGWGEEALAWHVLSGFATV